MNSKQLDPEVISVGKFLQMEELEIPPYQRPYKWTVKNVKQLLNDVNAFKTKSAYRLGSIVIHNDNESLKIVDGQQRTITLLLIARAILDSNLRVEIKNKDLLKLLTQVEAKMIRPTFSNDISIENIQTNYPEIVRTVASMDEDTVQFLFSKCEFIKFELHDISEAFQFFDSQNARGKDLEPHDLLKAFHLRELSPKESEDQIQLVDTWESMQTNELSSLFGEYLFRIKGWSKGNSSRFFTKNDIGLFKGININKVQSYPYIRIIKIAHFYTDKYNLNYERNIDNQQAEYPFQLDQTIINGKRFFEMITHYKGIFDHMLNTFRESSKLEDKRLIKIFDAINTYEGKDRIGDRYVRTLFDCAVIYYIDKFGFDDIPGVVEKLFIWSYTLRLRHQAVYFASVDNYVITEINVFRLIKDAITPHDVLGIYLPVLEKNSKKSTRTLGIEKIFTQLKYYDG